MLITFSGLDGAGKSTLIERLRSACEQRDRRVAVFHMNDHVGVYAYLRAVRDRLIGPRRAHAALSPTARPTPPSGPVRASLERMRNAFLWSRSLRRLIYPVDLITFLLYRLYVEWIRNRILIMDRYFYDTLVDVADGRHWAWLRVLKRITPTPDLPIYLAISPEESFARKGEYSIPYLLRRADAYREVFSWVPSAVTLHNGDLEETARTLEHLALGTLEHLTLEEIRPR